MNIVEKKIDELIPYEKNPRKNKEAVKYVAESIKQFGFKVPIIIDKNNVIVAGHTRLLGAKKIGLKTVPCIIADDLTDEQIKAFRIADNKVSEFAEWDFDLLGEELDNIFDIDMQDFGFDIDELDLTDEDEIDDDKYTTKTDIPQYEITGEQPDLTELVDDTKTNELLEEIENANISEAEKDFLRKASQRHLTFNYRNVAEYYAHADKEMQELMEKSALVIIDINDAIKNGYVKMSEELNKIAQEDKEDV